MQENTKSMRLNVVFAMKKQITVSVAMFLMENVLYVKDCFLLLAI